MKILLIILVLFMGCNSSTEPEPISIVGIWDYDSMTITTPNGNVSNANSEGFYSLNFLSNDSLYMEQEINSDHPTWSNYQFIYSNGTYYLTGNELSIELTWYASMIHDSIIYESGNLSQQEVYIYELSMDSLIVIHDEGYNVTKTVMVRR